MYAPNNIRFRIISSHAIAQFKQDQAFDFNELINSESFVFSPQARELLLLNYEVWFKFICRLERMMIRYVHNEDDLAACVDAMETQARDAIEELADVIQLNPSIFNPTTNFYNIVRKAHRPYRQYIFDIIKDSENKNMYTAFPRIVNVISNSLHNLLFILHEVESLYEKTPQPFLSFTEEVLFVYKKTYECPLIQRAILYKEQFGTSEFVIKNYTSDKHEVKTFQNLIDAGFQVTDVLNSDDFVR